MSNLGQLSFFVKLVRLYHAKSNRVQVHNCVRNSRKTFNRASPAKSSKSEPQIDPTQQDVPESRVLQCTS